MLTICYSNDQMHLTWKYVGNLFGNLYIICETDFLWPTVTYLTPHLIWTSLPVFPQARLVVSALSCHVSGGGGLTTRRLLGAFRFPFFCAGCSPDFGFLRADALDHHRAASPEPLDGRCEASLGFGCAGCWFLSFQSCHNWQCHTLEFLGGLGPPKNLFSFVDIYEVTIYMYLCRYLIRVDIVYNQYCM